MRTRNWKCLGETGATTHDETHETTTHVTSRLWTRPQSQSWDQNVTARTWPDVGTETLHDETLQGAWNECCECCLVTVFPGTCRIQEAFMELYKVLAVILKMVVLMATNPPDSNHNIASTPPSKALWPDSGPSSRTHTLGHTPKLLKKSTYISYT